MRFLVAATIATLACGTAVNAQIDSEIEVLKSLATSTGGWDTISSGPWKVDTASSACGLGGWTGITCEKIADQDRVVEISFPFRSKINGNIAAIEFNKLPYLRKLYISTTELSGALPNLSTHPTLKSIDVTLNPTLNGPITTSNIPPQLERIYVRGSTSSIFNQGVLPSFDAVNATTLKSIGFEYAKVTGTLPSFERFINLEEAAFAGNTITGSVPRFGPSLRTLNLYDNELSGFDVANIPPTVQTLDLNKNKIVATFPDLSKLTDPGYIDLSSNGFNGPVPLNRIPAPFKGTNVTDFVDYTYRLNFNDNSLTGTVPAFTNEWLQSRAAPGVTHKLRWSADCNLFQTGLPSLAPYMSECYDNKASQCTNCAAKVPGSTSGSTTPPPSGNGTTPPPTKTNTTTSPPTKPAQPKNDAAATTATSLFTGVIAVMAAFAARF